MTSCCELLKITLSGQFTRTSSITLRLVLLPESRFGLTCLQLTLHPSGEMNSSLSPAAVTGTREIDANLRRNSKHPAPPQSVSVANKNLISDPTIRLPGFNVGLSAWSMLNQSINQTRQFLTRRNTAKPLQGRDRTRPPRPTL